jgi:hypothetical protein
MWFHNQARPTSKSSKSDLKLNQTEKRKRAPIQAFCTYNWGSGLKETVSARWEEHRKALSTAEGASSTAATSSSHVPIDFKIKVVTEVYNALPDDEKKKVDERRDEEWKRLYQPIRVIEHVGERDKKLASHEL